ncbi:MAG TPA: glutamate--tRNA ligase [Terriglobales bacterium]|nr:glutamate--tRNA ligase [Terriglobales bacterium]
MNFAQKISATPRLRFAPSPTGYLHVGGARTALFNWLYARHYGGTLVLRIEDTDLERSTPEMVDGILVGLRWLGIDWDEGPYQQTDRMALYRAAADRLVHSGHAYYCFCTKEQLEQQRAQAVAEGGVPRDACRDLPAGEVQRRLDAGQRAATRFAVPQTGSTLFEDAVFGRVEVVNAEIEDFVLLRSDGVPTYHLSVVVDDLDMRITHVLRGADHLSNTPKQIMLYEALGGPLPVFAHVPLILGPDKTRLSKRHGATSVIAYKEQGILPEAFRNFLALLGWTPPNPSQEILRDHQLIELFDLNGIQKSNAIFDRAKLDWFNTEYIRATPAAQLLPMIEKEWQKAGIIPIQANREAIEATIELIKPRARSLKDFATLFRAYFSDSFELDPAAAEKFVKDDAVQRLLVELAVRYEQAAEFTEISAERVLRDFAVEKQVKAGALINGARVALTGQGVAPSLFAVMVNLGQQRTVARLKRVPELLGPSL